MSQPKTMKLDDTYLLVKKCTELKKLRGQPGEVYFSGRTDELCAILVEAMRLHEFVRVVVHYAEEEYEKRYGAKRDEQDPASSPRQLALSF
jgi:hypothetical protein